MVLVLVLGLVSGLLFGVVIVFTSGVALELDFGLVEDAPPS
jgi:hypothetical protein